MLTLRRNLEICVRKAVQVSAVWMANPSCIDIRFRSVCFIQGAIQSTTLYNSHSWDNAKRSRIGVSFLHMDVKGVVARMAQAE